ncbi:MAG: endonuclease/exonuclease/phosphatase family protein [Deltaproteobacteria bacterium]|nr:endonuclease/exonuclease/phosphatase family protein [Deltaproteobacteria bacterium]
MRTLVSSTLRLLRVLTFGSILCSALNLLPLRFWLIELNRAFSLYYLFFHLCALLLVMLMGRIFLPRFGITSLLLAGLSLYYAAALRPFYFAPSRVDQNTPAEEPFRLKLLYANLLRENPHKTAFKELIAAQQADLVMLLELTPEWSKSLAMEEYYPFRHEILSAGYFGLGLYSKFPLGEKIVENLGDFTPPVIIAEVDAGRGGVFEVVLFHAWPPLSAGAWDGHFATHRRVLMHVKHSAKELIMAADFNATPFASVYRAMLGHGRLQNAMHGFGLLRTWQAQYWYLRFTIDHVLYRGNFVVDSFERLPATGSDHFPLLVQFRRTQGLAVEADEELPFER